MRLVSVFTTILFSLATVGALIAQGYPVPSAEQGIASFYADYLHGQPTASGEMYRRELMTCAHMTHPVGTLLSVTRVDNGRRVLVRVNDRGAFQHGVIIDLSGAAALALDMVKPGKVWVVVEKVGYAEAMPVPADMPASYGQENPFTARGASGSPAAATYSGPLPFAGQSGFGIQLGAYGVFENAVRAHQHLKNLGLQQVWIQQTSTPEGLPLYRILLSSFLTRGDAENYLERYLKAIHLIDGLVISIR